MRFLLITSLFILLTTVSALRSSRHKRLRKYFDPRFDALHDPDTSTCHYRRKNNYFGSQDISGAHGGLFKDIKWSREEILKISDLHATQQYHLLGPFLREKLYSMNADPEYIDKAAAFFRDAYPPEYVRKIHTNESKCRIRKLLSETNIDMQQVQMVIGEMIIQQNQTTMEKIGRYVNRNSRPRKQEDEENFAAL